MGVDTASSSSLSSTNCTRFGDSTSNRSKSPVAYFSHYRRHFSQYHEHFSKRWAGVGWPGCRRRNHTTEGRGVAGYILVIAYSYNENCAWSMAVDDSIEVSFGLDDVRRDCGDVLADLGILVITTVTSDD